MEKIVETQNLKNTEIVEILEKYNHYGHLKYDDWKAFMDYHKELSENLKHKDFMIKKSALTDEMYKPLEAEFEEIDFIKSYKFYRSTMVSLYTMNGELEAVFEADSRHENTFYGLNKLVKQVNCYFEIAEPHKAPNKIAYGWNFAFKKADKSCFYKGVKLYLWGCIKNYLIKNGVEFDKETSLKVRKIVGLVDVKDTIE